MKDRRLLIAAGWCCLDGASRPPRRLPQIRVPSSQRSVAKPPPGMATAARATDKQRAAKLKPLLERHFKMPSLARYMLGSYWRKATGGADGV